MHNFGQNSVQIFLAQKGDFLVHWPILLWSNYCTPSYYIPKFLKSESWDIIVWDIRFHNFLPKLGPNCTIVLKQESGENWPMLKFAHNPPGIKTSWGRRSNVSLYVPVTLLGRLKWNTQRRLDRTSPRRLSGTSPRRLIRTS